mgnify:CR=1 FL=1
MRQGTATFSVAKWIDLQLIMIISLNLRDKTVKDEAQQAKAQVFSGWFSSQSTGLLQTLLAAEIAAIFLDLRVRDDHPIALTAASDDES